jgi:hypothetical protein
VHCKEGLLYDVHCLHFHQNCLSSKYVQQSEIEKHGPVQDKANLPQATQQQGIRLTRGGGCSLLLGMLDQMVGLD